MHHSSATPQLSPLLLLLSPPQPFWQQCSLSTKLVDNSDLQVSHDSISAVLKALKNQSQARNWSVWRGRATPLHIRVFKLIFSGNDSQKRGKLNTKALWLRTLWWKWKCSISPRPLCHVTSHQKKKRTLKHLPLQLIGDSFPFGFEGRRELHSWSSMGTESRDKSLLSREREWKKQAARWCEWLPMYRRKAPVLLLCPAWVNTHSLVHTIGGVRQTIQAFPQRMSNGHFWETVLPLNHVQSSLSLFLFFLLATVLKDGATGPGWTGCRLVQRESQVKAGDLLHLCVGVKCLQACKHSLSELRHLVGTNSSYIWPVFSDFCITPPPHPPSFLLTWTLPQVGLRPRQQ